MISNLIWDVGGTMFDTYPATTAAFLAALAELGISAPLEWVRALARVSQRHCARTLAQTYALDEERLWAAYWAARERAAPEQQPPFPGVIAVCRAVIQRGGVNLIATHRERERVEQLLRFHHLQDLVAGINSTSDGFPRKPDPAMLDDLAARFQLDRAQCLVLGDREIDIQAGQLAGMRTALFGDAQMDLRPDFTIQDHTQLLALLA